MYREKEEKRPKKRTGQEITYPVPHLLELKEDIAQRVMVGVELDLAGAIEEDVGFAELAQTGLQPLEVVLELLEGVEDAAVGAQAVVGHDLLEGDEVPDVERARVVRLVVCWVQVHYGAVPPDRPHELVHYILRAHLLLVFLLDNFGAGQ